jgi:serine protease Do
MGSLIVMSEQAGKSISLSYGLFAVILLLTLLIGILSGVAFGAFALSRLANAPSPTSDQTMLPARAWMGVTYIPLTPASARMHDLTVTAGALVVTVAPNSPAETAGVREDDIITAVDGRTINDSTSVMDAIKDKKSGDAIKVTLLRDGSEQTLDVTLGRSPAGPAGSDRNPFDRLRRGMTRIFGGE